MKKWMRSSRSHKPTQELNPVSEPKMVMNDKLDANREQLEKTFENCSDIALQSLVLFGKQTLMVYVDGMVDKMLLEHELLQTVRDNESKCEAKSLLSLAEQLRHTLRVGQIRTADTFDALVKGVLDGGVAIVLDGEPSVLIVGLERLPSRSVEEPEAEPLIRGPREGFIEQVQTNIILLRKRLKTPRFKIESFTVGELTQTKVAVVYIDGIATDSVVQEVRERITQIEIDGVIESNYIEEFIEDMPFSPFPQVHTTERPDIVAANLLEGKIAILVDGSPAALIVPITFWNLLLSAEDYYERFLIPTFIRYIRFGFILISLFLPSLYVAVAAFHPEMIPTNLLLSIAGAREASPFPALAEALLMEITFEGLREAGVRLPRQVGSAVSIVGGLVIGQAAVQAGIVSAPMVIVVSITAIANFTIPRFNFAFSTRLLRFPLILLAGTLGLYGIGLGFVCILIHLNSLRSFGIPYFEPVAPLSIGGLKDILFRAPHWAMKLRPRLTGYNEPLRVPSGQRPGPNQSHETDKKEGQ
ncbi:spore germination protein [Paenibacillus sp. sptzw28]|uniref:spore germination protein n=1 Tax=Paenibacillus sp. sptzw28 TaxID=715179 RepID=UPI001C6DFD81|nr:spore germination protein [Paenibacillus sp. sptzw28]QYR21812.1 spore germination protein [Paenibacillus sp. sptzw28]